MRFQLGELSGTITNGVLTIDGDVSPNGVQELLQSLIDYALENQSGYMPGEDATARKILLSMGATVADETPSEEGIIY